jgi:AbrB family looped-hinge helix DNA binding protein
MVDGLSVVVGKGGRLSPPKRLRERYNVREGSRLIIREHAGQIVLVPVTVYESPTESLHASVRTEQPIEEPKETARRHIREKLRGV